MAFLPSIMFELEIAPLQHKKPQGLSATEIKSKVGSLPEGTLVTPATNQGNVPLGLRWRVNPELGLPREPFFVWRRDRRKGDPVDVRYKNTQAAGFHAGKGLYVVPGGPFYILILVIQNTSPSAALIVNACDTKNNPVMGQVVGIAANTTRTVRFQHPFIGGFSVTGSSTIRSITGVTMKKYISLDDWELIQIAGLPAEGNELAGYAPGQQGYPSQLTDPADSARQRIKTAQPFYLPLPVTLPSGVQVPGWEIPDDTEAVDELRKGTPPLLERIGKMLKAVDDGDVHSQADFILEETVPGIHQPEFPGQSTPDATLNMPLLVTVLINAFTDPWFALASGFGVTDFPASVNPADRVLEPPSYFHVSHDYRVTSTFRFRFEGEVFTDPTYKEEYCALSHKSVFPPLPVTGLSGSVFSLNRPPHRDEPWSVEGALTWTKLSKLQIQGNAIAMSETGVNGTYLNTLRPAALPHKPALFVPVKPGDTSDPILTTVNRFIHSQIELPFTGNRENRYGVASMDAFGRWSDWGTTEITLSARPPESPRLISLSLTPDKSRIAGNTAPNEMVFEILWDWQDRSPKSFQLAGVFHRRLYLPDGTKDNGHIPPTDYPSIFQTDNQASGGPLLQLSFNSDVPPGTPPDFTSLPTSPGAGISIELLPQATGPGGQNVEGEMRRYRVKVADVNIAFNPDEEWYFTLFVKAAEWRNPALFSDTVPPVAPGRPPKLTTFVPNPIPAPPPVFIPPDIIWTPLPDARGISRLRLTFDRVPNATGGYAIYRAYEAKIRDKAELPVRQDADLIGRATDLRDIAMAQDRCLDAFTRINETLIPQPPQGTGVEYEIGIPGTMDGLVVLSVASVTREQETSALSKPWLFVAVPRRSVPGTPALSLKQKNGAITLACEFPKAPKPSVVEIFRSQREFVARDVAIMGIPVQEVTDAGWQNLDEEGNPAAGPESLHHYRFLVNDNVPASWFPYFYRAVATGEQDMINGFIPGRSPQSNLVKADRLPSTLPEIKDVTAVQSGSQAALISFRSDAVLEVTPHGTFKLEIFAWDFTQKKFSDTAVPSVFLNKATPVPATVLKGELYFLDADPEGFRTFQVTLDVTGSSFLFKIRLTDPLTHVSERMVSGEITQTEPPDLSGLQASRSGRDLLLLFESNAPVTPPPFGKYVLEITFATHSTHGRLLLRRSLDEIPVGNLAKLHQATVTTILRDGSTHSVHPSRYGAIIKGFYPVREFLPVHGVIRIKLTAPDNSSAVAVINI